MGFLHQISMNWKIDDLVTGGTINLQLTQEEKYARMEYVFLKDAIHHVVQDGNARIEYVFLKDAIHHVI